MKINELTTNPFFWQENPALLRSDKRRLARALSTFLMSLDVETLRFDKLAKLNKNLSIVSILNNHKLNAQAAVVQNQYTKVIEGFPASIEVMFDIACTDHNRAILDDLVWALNSEFPLITTRTLFRGANIEKRYCSYNEVIPGKIWAI